MNRKRRRESEGGHVMSAPLVEHRGFERIRRGNLRLIMRGYANKTSKKKKGSARSPGERVYMKLQAHFVLVMRP